MPRERQLKHDQDVLSEAEFMLTLLDDVLTVNKARAGKLVFDPEPLDLVIFCETELGAGTTFTVSLPVAKSVKA